MPSSVTLAIEDILRSIRPQEVTVGGEIGRRMDVTLHNNLMQLDWEEGFLKPFRTRKSSVSTYVGLGKVIDSAVRFAAYSEDASVVHWKNCIVDQLLETQDSDGYIGTYPSDIRMWVVWDVHEMSYIVLGLTSDYLLLGNENSLKAARRLMNYMISCWEEEPGREIGGENLSYWLPTTGFEQAVLALFRATGDEKYLDFCIEQRQLPAWDEPIVVGRHGEIEGHVYAYVARCLAQQELYRILGDERLLDPSRKVVDFIMRHNAMVISGACGQAECWDTRQDGTGHLGETCASAHLVYFFDSLLRLEANSFYGDMMERVIFNTLFAAQSPEGRRIRYYTPLQGQRRYFESDGYCCPSNFRRILSDLSTMVTYRVDGGLAINLYTPSTLCTELSPGLKLTVEQRTDYPNSGDVQIRVDPQRPFRFPVKLRIPRWCKEAQVDVNRGAGVNTIPGGSFYTIDREWRSGDVVQLGLPMEWRIVTGVEKQAGRAAIMRGPVLFCLNPRLNERTWAGLPDRFFIDPSSVSGPEPNETVRPNGLACRIKVGSPTTPVAGGPDAELLLTEFPDPDAIATYFPVADTVNPGLVNDELFYSSNS